MELNEIYEIIQSTQIPCAYRMFPEAEAPPLPFICYFEDGTSNFGADGIVYHEIDRIYIELYSKNKDKVSEFKVENALNSHRLFWNKQETYIAEEKCYEVIYSLEV